jgi:hypothetical protein
MDSTCCSQSYIAQKEIFWSHQLMWEQLEQAGYEVDVFAATIVPFPETTLLSSLVGTGKE